MLGCFLVLMSSIQRMSLGNIHRLRVCIYSIIESARLSRFMILVAVVGSGDSLCSTSAVRVCQQYPKQGKCSIETIIGLTEMVAELLHYYRQANKVLPNKIVFYRDGKSSKIISKGIKDVHFSFPFRS